MTNPPARPRIEARDFLRFRFYRYLAKAIWLFFPALIFLGLAYACFWKLTQGKDLMVITLENRDVFTFFIIAQVFWSYVTWYTSRLVGKVEEFERPCEDPIWTTLRVQGPRLLAFTCFTIIILAFFQLSAGNTFPQIPDWMRNLILIASIPLYFLVYSIWDRFTDKVTEPESRKKFLMRVQLVTWIISICGIIVEALTKSFTGLIFLLLLLQQALVLLLLVRRKIIESKGDAYFQQTDNRRGFNKGSTLAKKLSGLLFDREDRGYFIFFICAGLIAAFFYLSTVFNVGFSVRIGTFPFVFLAFSLLLFFGNMIAFFSVLKHFNFHIILIGVAFLIGHFLEPHYVQLVDKKNRAIEFKKRQDLKEYFYRWINEPSRKSQLDDPRITSYPVFLTLADGGASRSGYWVASVLSKLEDSSRGQFSKHLFCLSGASGGSVGNAAFFSLLRNKIELSRADSSANAYLNAATGYLKSDFLTFTLARMLGPDVFRHIVPLRSVDDRAAALAHALESASGKKSFLYHQLGIPLTEIITQKNDSNYSLPVLCINVTRMQDGSPGVISNINLGDSAFNNRIEVLNLIDEEKDIKLSSAVVLGASFPYVSPAGRIDTKMTITDSMMNKRMITEPYYFVDGGYFDNSGAGVVNEMLIRLRSLLASDTSFTKYAGKLKFYTIHISNSPLDDEPLGNVNPFTNDLAAPIKTLIGAYGTQTAVNDRRLQNFLRGWYGKDDQYITINLYKPHEQTRYSMNWVISGYLLETMNKRLRQHEGVGQVISLLHQFF